MKLAALIDQQTKHHEQLMHLMNRMPGDLSPARAPEHLHGEVRARHRRVIGTLRRHVALRMQARQRVARTLAGHPEVVDLLTARKVARLRVRLLVDLRNALQRAGRAHWVPPSHRESWLLPNGTRRAALSNETDASDWNAARAVETLKRLLNPSLPGPGPWSQRWTDQPRRALKASMSVAEAEERLRAARRQLRAAEQQLEAVCARIEGAE